MAGNHYGFILTISVVSFVFNLVKISPEYNNALYSTNCICFVGFLCMIALNPHGFYRLYGPVFGLPEPEFYLLAILFHLFPVVWFYGTYSLGNPMIPFLTYLVVFGPYLEEIYPFPAWKTVAIGIALVLGFIYIDSV